MDGAIARNPRLYPELLGFARRLGGYGERCELEHVAVSVADHVLGPRKLNEGFPESAIGEDGRATLEGRPRDERTLEVERRVGNPKRLESVLAAELRFSVQKLRVRRGCRRHAETASGVHVRPL